QRRLQPRPLSATRGCREVVLDRARHRPAPAHRPGQGWQHAGGGQQHRGRSAAECARRGDRPAAAGVRAVAPLTRVVVANDDLTADEAYGLVCQGTSLLWRGDFQNARQLLNALARRAERQLRKSRKAASSRLTTSPAEAFHLHRQAQAQRARTLSGLLVPLEPDYTIPLRRAPDIRQACVEAYGTEPAPSVASLQALLGVIGAHEWRAKGVEIAAAGGRIHPHYGVFAPIRHEYVDLVASAPLPASSAASVAFDIGTGTGVLAAVLARRGIQRVIATDLDVRAVACARENVARLGLAKHVEVVQLDLFPEGR